MKKKIIIIIIGLLLPVAAYLFVAYYYMYQKIEAGALSVVDTKTEYLIKASVDKGVNLKYTALGDSLTAGIGASTYEESYPYLLAQEISNGSTNVILRDRAYPGARTGDLIENLLPTAINDQPDVATVLIGINDVMGNVSKVTFTENYTNILKRLKTETKARILTISIPYIGTDKLILPPYNSYFRHEIIEYNKIIRELAAANNVEYVDLYTQTENMFDNEEFFSRDLFHPSAKGYELWAKIIYANFNN